MNRTYTKEQFEKAVKTSLSKRETLIKLGLKPAGAGYTSFNRAVEDWCVDISHFKGKGWNRGKKLTPRRTTKEYLSGKFKITSHKLRLRLLKEGYFEYRCSNCKMEKWLERPIPLELDHIDGDHENNNLENLRILCPNCHAFTPNYRGRNKAKSGASDGI